MSNRIREDVFVYYASMPNTIDEMVLSGPDGYSVYINSNLTYEKQRHAYLHALGHIERGDIEDETRTVSEKELDDPVRYLKELG